MKDHSKITRMSSYSRFGFLLSTIGIILAVDTFSSLSFLYKLWPLLIVMLGIGFIGIYIRRSRREAAYIGVGTYLIGFSGVALYCNLTSWTALSSIWPLFIGLFGISCVLGYFFGRRSPALILTGLLFVSLSTVFFFVFEYSSSLWWTVFVFSGISFIVFDKARQA